MASVTGTAPESLRLAWPSFIRYHSDLADPISEGPSSFRDSEQRSSSSKCNDYNGMRLGFMGDAQVLGDDEFRLLDLHPGEPDMPLIGALRKVRLSGHDVYEPLSYTWEDHPTDVTKDGNDIHPFLFLHDNYDAEACIQLQTNCARALCRIRDDRVIRTVWVDAICINQSDLAERSRQVSLMERIYSRPHTVVVYVGHESKEHHSHMAMRLLNNPEMLNAGPLDDLQRSSIHHFVNRPYFRRMWIVQECALATSLKLICGPDEVYISEFTRTSLEILVAARQEQVIPAWLKHSRQMPLSTKRPEGSAQAKQLLGLMFDTASCECSELKDRIFALLSLLGTVTDEDVGYDKRLVADYSLSVEQVYSGIAAFFVENGFLGTMLKLAALTRADSVACLPSWVPDWSKISVEMRRTLWLEHYVEDNISWREYSRMRYVWSCTSTLHSDQVSEGPVKHLTWLRTRLDIGTTCFPRFWNSGAVTVQVLLLGKVDSDGYFIGPGASGSQISAVCLPAPDFSWTTLLKEKYVDSGDYEIILSERWPPALSVHQHTYPQGEHSSGPGDYSTDQELRRRHDRIYLLSQDLDAHLHFTDFDGSTLLSDSERRSYSQMLPQHLESLKKWPNLWTRPLESRCPTPTLQPWIVEEICSVRPDSISALILLWQRWNEQAPLGRQILQDEDQIQLVLDEIERVGTLGNICKAIWPRSLLYTGDDSGGFALASFLALFIKDPDVLENSEPIQIPPQQLLRRTDASLAPCSLSNEAVPRNALTQHLMAWAQTTFELFTELQNAVVDQSLEIMAKLTSPHGNPPAAANEIWRAACNTIRYQFRVAKLMCRGEHQEQPTRHAVFLLNKIRHELPQARKPGMYPHGRRRIAGEEYWDWTRLTEVFSPELLGWASAQADQDKVRHMRRSMDHGAWEVFKSKLPMVDRFAEVGVNLVEPEFTALKIV